MSPEANETKPDTQWNSHEFWGKPTPEQERHAAQFQRTVARNEQRKNEFMELSPVARGGILVATLGGFAAIGYIYTQFYS